jgi:hypothetical protein
MVAAVSRAACKRGGGFSFSSRGGSSGGGGGGGESASAPAAETASGSSDGTTDSAPPALSASEQENKDKLFLEIDDATRGEAWFQKYVAAPAVAKCTTKVPISIDWASFAKDEIEHRAVVGTNWCGGLADVVATVCGDATGKELMKAIESIRCERLIGKATTKKTTKLFTAFGDKHAYDLDRGKLTMKLGVAITSGFYASAVIENVFPRMRWQREVDDQVDSLQRHFTEWSENKDGIDFTVDIDPAGFATTDWVPFYYLCGGDGNSGRPYPEDGKLADFIELLYDKTDKGKKILQGIKRVTCSATADAKGKPPEVVGDRLIFYARALDDHHKASYYAPTGQRFPTHDAYFAYALFRKAKNLGGECPWPRYDPDPEADRLCGKAD